MSHFVSFLFVSFFVSLTFAFLMRNEPRKRLIYGLKMFFSLIGIAIAAGWILYFLPWW